MTLRKAIFLDRDGVLVADNGFVTQASQFQPLPGVHQALRQLSGAGFLLLVVTNQALVARGLLSEGELEALHGQMNALFEEAGAPRMDGIYACPHHPNATLPQYRTTCECRKPRPGLLRAAAHDHGIDLNGSFLVGDRFTDILAGSAAGCRTVWVQTGQHLAPAIETADLLDQAVSADHVCADLLAASAWILNQL